MTLHIFSDPDLMLVETAGFDLCHEEGICYSSYRQRKRSGPWARMHQVLHLLTRPLNLRLSAWFLQRFNEQLVVDPEKLGPGLARVKEGDSVLWLNPSRAVSAQVASLGERGMAVALYFVDPVHRLGLSALQIRSWASWAHLATYSRSEAARFGMAFLAPHVPVLALARPVLKDLDLVYVGSPSPKRLLWVLSLRMQLWLRGRRGHLRLASRNRRLARWFPNTFSSRISFTDYAALCARSRGVLELHERDAEGVTLRATLSQAVHAVHLCNVRTTEDTCVISAWRWHALDGFLARPQPASTGAPGAPASAGLLIWLQTNFQLSRTGVQGPCPPDSRAP